MIITKTSVKKYLPYVLGFGLVAMALILTTNPVFAAAPEAVHDALDIVKRIGQWVCLISGAIMLLIGIIRFASAHSDENTANEKKAINMITAALVLIVLGALIMSIPLDSIVDSIASW